VGAGAPLPVELDDVRCAALSGHTEMLRWVREHGCPAAVHTGTGGMVEYIEAEPEAEADEESESSEEEEEEE